MNTVIEGIKRGLGNLVVTELADAIDRFGYDYNPRIFSGYYLDSDMTSQNTAQMLVADKYTCVCLEKNLKDVVLNGDEHYANEAGKLLKGIQYYRKLRYKYKLIIAK